MTEYSTMQDLLGNTRYLSPKKGRALDERAGLVKYFADLFQKDGKVLALRLAHLKLPDLYYIQSEVKDRLNRQDLETARKWFYYSTKTS